MVNLLLFSVWYSSCVLLGRQSGGWYIAQFDSELVLLGLAIRISFGRYKRWKMINETTS